MEEKKEFNRRLNRAGTYIAYIDGGRTMDVVVKIRGIEIARKTMLYRRGKTVNETYSLPVLDWTDPLLAP